jgi:hypothetical protein
MPHLVLLGDSIFDNAAYVQKDFDVASQLRLYLAKEWTVTLLAADGSTTLDLHVQLSRIPSDATHLILSVGGNDALRELPFLQEEAQTNSGAITRLAALIGEFKARYQSALDKMLLTGLPLALCTIYHPRFPDFVFQLISETVLANFNDVIITRAIEAKLPVLDLRQISVEAKDFSNTIEPSELGGKKIASAIARLFHDHDFGSRKTVISG